MSSPRPRADTSPPTSTSQPPIKRFARSDSPIFLASSGLMPPRNAKRSRRRFLHRLSTGEPYPGTPKPIPSPDQLTEVQLKKCFDMLHACGRATDEGATLETTRASMEGFLDAVFRHWRWDAEEGMVKPELEFLVEAEIVAGTICTTPSHHPDSSTCHASTSCSAEITASVSYSCNPAMLRMEFTMLDPFTGQSEAFCPLGRTDIRWVDAWRESLRKALTAKLVAKLHRYNKHLAVWHARKLIQGWSRGSVCLGPDVGEMGFMGEEAASSILVALADSE
ncbi:hypothetical protein E4U43_003378 [Claviceps pusilla]|uniref:Uncharacterized protein n=1 Tax=Claviceps pusilla TaxID=123648 RepID=A0A9P7SWT4_9HYPO|nr:hypothetical protein E4U43_003378 [Claviceps pusilla]